MNVAETPLTSLFITGPSVNYAAAKLGTTNYLGSSIVRN